MSDDQDERWWPPVDPRWADIDTPEMLRAFVIVRGWRALHQVTDGRRARRTRP